MTFAKLQWFTVASLAAAFLLSGFAQGQDATWQDIVQVVEIRPDGTVLVEDTRTAQADDGFREAFVCIGHGRNQSVTLHPSSGAQGPGPSATAFTQACDNGTELVVRNASEVTERRVRFSYVLEGSVDAYTDVVQWYWHILESEHLPVRGYDLTVIAPGPMAEPYDAFVHRFSNPEEPRVEFGEDRRTLRVRFDRVPEDVPVEIRYLMDPRLFTIRGDGPGFEELLLDEAKEAGVQTRIQVLGDPRWGLIPLALVLLMGFLLIRAYRRVGKEPPVQAMKYPFEPPTDLAPAAVSTITDQNYTAGRMGAAFHATIMDLMRRGYGTFEPRPGKKVDIRLNPNQPRDVLLPFEQDVLRYLELASGSDELITHAELKKYSERHASSFVSGWGKKVRSWLLEQRGGELTTEESRREARRWAGYSALAALLPGVLIFVFQRDAMALMVVGVFALMGLAIVALVSLPAWRPEIAQEVAEWQGFKRTLTDYTRMKDAPLDFFELWDVYYAYAAAMGVAENYLKTLQRAAPLAGANEQSMVRSAAWMGLTGSNASVSNLAGLSSSITSLSSALSSASATASSGGSVSGGGGGGGGGGSSGVR